MLKVDGKGSKRKSNSTVKGKEYIALLYSGELETYHYGVFYVMMIM